MICVGVGVYALMLVLNVIFKPDNMRVNGARTDHTLHARNSRAAAGMIQVLTTMMVLWTQTLQCVAKYKYNYIYKRRTFI